VSERRRAELDGGRSELSAAEGGTIGGRRPMTRVIAPPPLCDECGFTALESGSARAAADLRSSVAAYRPLLTSGDPAVRRRPDEKTWSPVEYGAHMADVVAIWNWTLKQALTEERPQFPVPEPDIADRMAAESSYASKDPAAIADELEANTSRMAAKLLSVDSDGWSRVVLFGNEELSVLDIANKVLHEAHHHLQDIERMR
jgi:hypothetical protein